MLVITESENSEFNVDNYSPQNVERAVKSYEQRQIASKAYYARVKENPEWIQRRKERDIARRLKKKAEGISASSTSSASST